MRKIFVIGVFGLLLSIGMRTAPVLAQFEEAKSQACEGLEFDNADSTECDDSQAEEIDNVVATVVNILSLVVGVISVVMVIVGGIKYTLSQGDSNATASAKNTVIYAVVGLIIVMLAQLIVMFVINRATTLPPDPPPARTPPPGGSNRPI